MPTDLARKVSDLETFAGVAQAIITRLERRLAEVESRLGIAEAELKKIKSQS